MKTRSIILVGLLLAGCAPVSPYIRAYNGVVQPREEVGLVRVTTGPNVQVKSVNGRQYTSMPKEGDAYIALIGGERDHTITVAISGSETVSNFKVQRMHNYILQVDTRNRTTQLVDVTDKPEQWCLSCYAEPAMPMGTIADVPWQGV